MAKMIALQTIDVPAFRVGKGQEFDVDEKCVEAFVAMGKAKRKDEYQHADMTAALVKRPYRRRDMKAEH